MSDQIANLLRQTIQESELSGNQLAELTGIKQQTISEFLRGAGINLDTAQKLADHFGLMLEPFDGYHTPDNLHTPDRSKFYNTYCLLRGNGMVCSIPDGLRYQFLLKKWEIAGRPSAVAEFIEDNVIREDVMD